MRSGPGYTRTDPVPPVTDPTKRDIQKFWGSLYRSLYDTVEDGWTPETLVPAIDELEDMFRLRRHMAAVEMDLPNLAGKRVLEIGSGAGGHSALFARHGALVTAADLTADRIRATARKFALLGEHAAGCHAVQSDAENLPFADRSFDIVYSNGVLHHTLDTERAIAEVYRVLRPGGEAVIMLYCRDSWHYWINLLLCVGILQGKAFGDPNWVGKATEWGGRNRQSVANPITRCYTRRGIGTLFARFDDIRLRKADFYFYLIPKLGRLYRRYQLRRYGTHPGGKLVYGEPWPRQSPLEYRLGRIMGWSWFVAARRPLNT